MVAAELRGGGLAAAPQASPPRPPWAPPAASAALAGCLLLLFCAAGPQLVAAHRPHSKDRQDLRPSWRPPLLSATPSPLQRAAGGGRRRHGAVPRQDALPAASASVTGDFGGGFGGRRHGGGGGGERAVAVVELQGSTERAAQATHIVADPPIAAFCTKVCPSGFVCYQAGVKKGTLTTKMFKKKKTHYVKGAVWTRKEPGFKVCQCQNHAACGGRRCLGVIAIIKGVPVNLESPHYQRKGPYDNNQIMGAANFCVDPLGDGEAALKTFVGEGEKARLVIVSQSCYSNEVVDEKCKGGPPPVTAVANDSAGGDEKEDRPDDVQALPNGLKVGDMMYYTGDSSMMQGSNRLEYGAQGEVKGPYKGTKVLVEFPGNHGAVPCDAFLLSSEAPEQLPIGYLNFDLLYFVGDSERLDGGDFLKYGTQGELTGVKNGLLRVRFPQNRLPVGVLPASLSKQAPDPLPDGDKIFDVLYFTGNLLALPNGDTIQYGERGQLVSLLPSGAVSLRFPGKQSTVAVDRGSLSKEPPPPLPDGYFLGDELYYVGDTMTTGTGEAVEYEAVEYGKRGDVVGRSGEGENLNLLFPGYAAAINLPLKDLSREAPSALPNGFSLGDELYFVGTSMDLAGGAKLEYGTKGKVVGFRDGRLRVLFAGHGEAVGCLPEELAREGPQDLPPGHAVGEWLYYTGDSHALHSGGRLLYGQFGELVGLRSSAVFTIRFKGLGTPVHVPLAQLSKEAPTPVPDGFKLGDLLFFTGVSDDVGNEGGRLDYGDKGELVGMRADSILSMRFPETKQDSVGVNLTSLSKEAPPAMPKGFELGRTVYFVGDTRSLGSSQTLQNGDPGKVVGRQPAEPGGFVILLRFPPDVPLAPVVGLPPGELTGEEPPALTGGYRLEDVLYYTGEGIAEEGGELRFGQAAMVVGMRGGVVRMRVPGTQLVVGLQEELWMREAPQLPNNYSIGNKLYFIGDSRFDENGTGLEYGKQGTLVGLLKTGLLLMRFPANTAAVGCEPSDLARTAPDAPPGGRGVGELLYFTGEAMSDERGDRVEYGQRGQVVGAKDGLLRLAFPGSTGAVACTEDLLSTEAPEMPDGYGVGDEVCFVGDSVPAVEGNRVEYGKSGRVVGLLRDLRLLVRFEGNPRAVGCRAADLSREAPSPLPEGIEVLEQLFFIGDSTTVEGGHKLAYGQQGQVVAAASNGAVRMLFPGNTGAVACRVEHLSRKEPMPLPTGYGLFSKFYFVGDSQDLDDGTRLQYGQQGKVVGRRENGDVAMLFDGGPDAVPCSVADLSEEAPERLPEGRELGTEVYFAGNFLTFDDGARAMYGARGVVVGLRPNGDIGVRFGRGLTAGVARTLLSKEDVPPMPEGFAVGQELYFTGEDTEEANHDKVVFGMRGVAVAPARMSGGLSGLEMSFRGNEDGMPIVLEELSVTAPQMPFFGFNLGDKVFFTWESHVFRTENARVYGAEGTVAGYLSNNEILVRFPTNTHAIACDANHLSREAPVPIPGNFEALAWLFYKGDSTALDGGKRLEYGERGQVLATGPDGALVTMLFPGNAGQSAPCRPEDLAREEPPELVSPYALFSKWYFKGDSRDLENGDKVYYGMEGEIVARRDNGTLALRFAGNRGSVACAEAELSEQRPEKLPEPYNLFTEWFFVGESWEEGGIGVSYGAQGKIVGLRAPDVLALRFDGADRAAPCRREDLSNEVKLEMPALPEDSRRVEVWEDVYFTGEGRTETNGDRLEYRLPGVVLAPIELESATGEPEIGLKVKFELNAKSVPCVLGTLSRRVPPERPSGREIGQEVYFSGASAKFRDGNELLYGSSGTVQGVFQVNSGTFRLLVRFPGNSRAVPCDIHSIDVKAPAPLPDGYANFATYFCVKQGDEHFGQQGEVRGLGSGFSVEMFRIMFGDKEEGFFTRSELYFKDPKKMMRHVECTRACGEKPDSDDEKKPIDYTLNERSKKHFDEMDSQKASWNMCYGKCEWRAWLWKDFIPPWYRLAYRPALPADKYLWCKRFECS